MVLYICFVDPNNTPTVVLKEDERCVVTDDKDVILKEGSDEIRIGKLDSFFPTLPSKGEWTFCTADKVLADAVLHALEAGSFCGVEPDSKRSGQIMKALEIGRSVGREGRG